MTINGKRDEFSMQDIDAVAKRFGIRNSRECVSDVEEAVASWTEIAKDAGVNSNVATRIAGTHRLKFK